MEHPFQQPSLCCSLPPFCSCLGYCTDVADALGVTSVRWAGDLTVPGALRFPDAPLQLTPADPVPPMVLMADLVP